MKRLYDISLFYSAFYCIAFGLSMPVSAAEKEIRVLCTTFPIYQITRNIVLDQPHVKVELMLPAGLGCPHDYALSPQDFKKLERATVLVINGLGLEEFLDALLKKAGRDIPVLDSSEGIKEILFEKDESEPADKGRVSSHSIGANPHLFASPRMAARIARNIARGLAPIDPVAGDNYLANGDVYSAKLNHLADELSLLGKQLANTRLVTQHGVFDYLARDMGLEVVAEIQAHAGQEPSAAEILSMIRIAKEKKAGAVFTEPRYPEKIGRTIASEVGITAAVLDPVATGPLAAGREYYEEVMRKNMTTLKNTLGTK